MIVGGFDVWMVNFRQRAREFWDAKILRLWGQKINFWVENFCDFGNDRNFWGDTVVDQIFLKKLKF